MREVSQNSYDKRALKNGFIVTDIKTFYTDLSNMLHMVYTNVDKWSLEYSSLSCWTDVNPSNQRKGTEFFHYRMIKNVALQ